MTINIRLPDFGKVVEDVTAEIKARVERRTPVDTGRAQSSWETSVTGHSARIFNETPYIGFLETGTSKMPGVYMVQTTLEEVPDIIHEAIEKQKQN